MHVHLAALGGTIASTGTGGVTPQVGAADIAAAASLDTLPATPELSFEQIAQVGSGSITLDHLADVVRAARRAAQAGARALVLTQGTDTLEETTFALSVMNDSGIPIITTGAMRNPTLPGADGPANVRSAVITALDPRIAALPALLVFADELHDPAFVRKSHTSSIATFTSGPAAGPIGWVSEDALVPAHMPVALPTPFTVPEAPTGPAASPAAAAYPQVALIEATLGDSLAWIDGLPDAGYSGAVIAGVGGGHVPADAAERVGALAQRIPVVLASRTGAGRTLQQTYGYPGSEIDLLGRGLIPAGRLDARKARLIAVLAIQQGSDVDAALEFYR